MLAVSICALFLWCQFEYRKDSHTFSTLFLMQPTDPPRYSKEMVDDLPEPVRRYFNRSIMPGTPLYSVAEIEMTGEFSLGTKDDPDYMQMSARQALAAPRGFIWTVKLGKGHTSISGSDGAIESTSWSRFWLMGLLPVARAGGTLDHLRAAFGRYVAEAVFWTPAALLPREGVQWKATGKDTVRVTVSYGSLSQDVDLSLDDSGQLRQVVFPRWSNANPDGVYQIQPFGGHLSNFRVFEGFHLPTRIEAGNHFGTEAYFPFIRADVATIRFPKRRIAQ